MIKGSFTMDISSIILESKKTFTRDRASVIMEFLKNNNDAVIISYVKKARGDSVRFTYLKDHKKVTSDFVINNAKIVIKDLQNKKIQLYLYDKNTIKEFRDEF